MSNDWPVVDYGRAWTELRGYVAEAVADGGVIDPSMMASYMDELEPFTDRLPSSNPEATR